MALYLTRADIRPFTSMTDAIEVMERIFATWSDPLAFNLERRRLPRQNGKVAHVLAGVAPGGETFGARVSAPQFANLMMLFTETDGGLAAIMECGPISEMRTGAASGVATRYLAREDSETLGLIGAGRTAFPQIDAACKVRPIKRIKVFARNEEARVSFAKDAAKRLGVEVVPVATAEAAARDSDIVVTATSAETPILLGEWLSPGTHVNAMGANDLRRREIDDATVTRADIVAIDHRIQGEIEAEALVRLVKAGKLAWADVAELGEIVDGRRKGRENPEQITLFHSLGLGFEDVSYAEVVLARAKAAGVGKQIG